MNKENVWMKTRERKSEELHRKSRTTIKPNRTTTIMRENMSKEIFFYGKRGKCSEF